MPGAALFFARSVPHFARLMMGGTEDCAGAGGEGTEEIGVGGTECVGVEGVGGDGWA